MYPYGKTLAKLPYYLDSNQNCPLSLSAQCSEVSRILQHALLPLLGNGHLSHQWADSSCVVCGPKEGTGTVLYTLTLAITLSVLCSWRTLAVFHGFHRSSPNFLTINMCMDDESIHGRHCTA